MKIVDGTDVVLGRMATKVAKILLAGESAAITNAERILLSGRTEYNAEKYLARRGAKNKANPEQSPKWPKRPDMLVKRVVRGMLPFYRSGGREAYKRLRVYMGAPEGVSGDKVEMEKVGDTAKYITIEKLCRKLGYNKPS